MSIPAPARRAPITLLIAAAAAACADGTAPERTPDPAPQTALICQASVRDQWVNCGSGPSGGASLERRILGEQGRFVRLASSDVSYAGGVFSFNVTVQNLSDLPYGTVDGAVRHGEGVRVFFGTPPTTTSGSGAITIANATGVETFTAAGQSYYQYGGAIGGTDQGDLGGDGILVSGEVSTPKNWQFNVPGTVNTFSFLLYVNTETPAGTLTTVAPQVTSISPSPLVPGAQATITVENAGGAGTNVVSIGGLTAPVVSTTPNGALTELVVTVPCTSSGNVPVHVTTGGYRGVIVNHPLQVTQHTLAVGAAMVRTSSGDSYCNELTSANGAARYLVAVFSASNSPSSNSPMQFSADGDGQGPALARQPALNTGLIPMVRPSLHDQLEAIREREADEWHHRILEQNADAYQRLYARHGSGPAVVRDAARDHVEPPLTRTFRVSNISPPAGQNICSSYYVVAATRVYYDGKVAIYEDDGTPDHFKAANSAVMASNYQRIGDQFNADMEPIVRNNFGDILRRDLDHDGALVALFTPLLNNTFAGVAGFVVSCDQFPNDDANNPGPGGPYTASNGANGNGASNFGEFFYAYQPAVNAAGYSGNTPENWYRTIRSTFIHESKHVASQAARVANNAPTYEASWLEEGTARHAEELWMRNAVDNQAWKSNIPYGSQANPINIYCDVRPGTTWPECEANPRRPASIMQRHFTSLYTFLNVSNARLLSPFGASPSDNAAYFYAISWSLVRYSIDRYGAGDAAFLSALNEATISGTANLSNVAGVSIDQLLGGWALSLVADDYPGLASPSADVQMPTWNFRSIFTGLNADFPSTYTRVFPQEPAQYSFGSFSAPAQPTLRGGGILWYEISGTQSAAQLLRLENQGGGLPGSNLRIAVARVQ